MKCTVTGRQLQPQRRDRSESKRRRRLLQIGPISATPRTARNGHLSVLTRPVLTMSFDESTGPEIRGSRWGAFWPAETIVCAGGRVSVACRTLGASADMVQRNSRQGGSVPSDLTPTWPRLSPGQVPGRALSEPDADAGRCPKSVAQGRRDRRSVAKTPHRLCN